VIRPALPSIDRKFLLKLLQLEIAAHPPQAAVLSFTLTAEGGQSSKVQLGLFAPQTPEPSRLDVTIARLKAHCWRGSRRLACARRHAPVRQLPHGRLFCLRRNRWIEGQQAAHGTAENAATRAGASPTAYNKARGLS
jgi:hypothetical protein